MYEFFKISLCLDWESVELSVSQMSQNTMIMMCGDRSFHERLFLEGNWDFLSLYEFISRISRSRNIILREFMWKSTKLLLPKGNLNILGFQVLRLYQIVFTMRFGLIQSSITAYAFRIALGTLIWELRWLEIHSNVSIVILRHKFLDPGQRFAEFQNSKYLFFWTKIIVFYEAKPNSCLLSQSEQFWCPPKSPWLPTTPHRVSTWLLCALGLVQTLKPPPRTLCWNANHRKLKDLRFGDFVKSRTWIN